MAERNEGPTDLLSDQGLRRVAVELGAEWKTVAIELGLKNAALEQIQTGNPHEKLDRHIFLALIKWRDEIRHATDDASRINELLGAITNAGRADLAQDLREQYTEQASISSDQENEENISEPLANLRMNTDDVKEDCAPFTNEILSGKHAINTEREIALMDIKTEKEDAIEEFRGEVALATSDVRKHVALDADAAFQIERLDSMVEDDLERLHSRVEDDAGLFVLNPKKDIIVIHSEEDIDKDRVIEFKRLIEETCATKGIDPPVTVEVLMLDSTGESTSEHVGTLHDRFRGIWIFVTENLKVRLSDIATVLGRDAGGDKKDRVVPVWVNVSRKNCQIPHLQVLRGINYKNGEIFKEQIVKFVLLFRGKYQ